MSYTAAALAGIGQTELGKVTNKTAFRMQAEASIAAIDDAGLEKTEIDGVLTEKCLSEPYARPSLAFAEYMGIEARHLQTFTMGGASHCSMVGHAAMLIAQGICENVLIVSADRLATGMTRNSAVNAFAQNRHPQFEVPYGIGVPSCYALMAQAHMHRYGTTREQLASVAVAMREHAHLNPEAIMRDQITVEDVLKSKPISSPLHLLDCSLVSDGGGAIVVSRASRVRDQQRPVIRVLSQADAYGHDNLFQCQDLTTTAAVQSGSRALEMAGISIDEIDAAYLYDSFTIAVLIQLEDLGVCSKGEAGEFVASGNIHPGGTLPVNTHGGLLSHCHPGQPGGIFHIIEAVKQLRGEATHRQLPDAKIALVHGVGGMMSAHSTLVVAKE